MGLIREPKGVDLIVEPSVLTDDDKRIISEIITNYKRTGKVPAKGIKRKETVRRKTIKKVPSSRSERGTAP